MVSVPLAIVLDATNFGSGFGGTSRILTRLLSLRTIRTCWIEAVAFDLSFAAHITRNRGKRLSCSLIGDGCRPSIATMILRCSHALRSR